MKIVRRALFILCAISLMASLFSCGTEDGPKMQKRTFYDGYFNAIYSTVYDYSGMEQNDFAALCSRVEGLLGEYNELYDIYNDYDGVNNLKKINDHAGMGPLKVDSRIIDLLIFAKEMHSETGGAVNIAMGSVLKIWHEYRNGGKGTELPPMDMLKDAANHTDIDAVIINEADGTVEITDPDLLLDVGAVAKGYAVEMIALELARDGYSGIVLDVGGNLRVIGEKPSGEGWTSGIRNPDSSSSQTYVYKTTLRDCALVTSGNYERYYTVGGVRYHHIINGETLMPSDYYSSVSVKSPSSAFSDALSTAFFNLEIDRIREISENLGQIFAVLVLPNGEVVCVGEDF